MLYIVKHAREHELWSYKVRQSVDIIKENAHILVGHSPAPTPSTHPNTKIEIIEFYSV